MVMVLRSSRNVVTKLDYEGDSNFNSFDIDNGRDCGALTGDYNLSKSTIR